MDILYCPFCPGGSNFTMFLRRVLTRESIPLCTRALSTTVSPISWQQTGKPQKTIASAVERSGIGLHSGQISTVRLLPAKAGEGRSFSLGQDPSLKIPATIARVAKSHLCTKLSNESAWVSTVEHLMSALEGCGVDNVKVEIEGGFEVPILDGSSLGWVEAIEEGGICSAKDDSGQERAKFAAVVNEPLYTWMNDSFIAAFPDLNTRVTYGIDFSQVPAIGCQWMSRLLIDHQAYSIEIAPSRTFCIFEEIEGLRNAGLIQGGSVENAIICSSRDGWMNPPLRFDDEPCRHKILDLIGDLSLLSENGNQGLPIAHLVAYKAGHALHAKFASMFKSYLINHKEQAIQFSPMA